MNFENAFVAIKGGSSARRSGWNGQGLRIRLGITAADAGAVIPTIPYLVILGDGVGGASLGMNCGVWTPSMGDLFAEDWEIV